MNGGRRLSDIAGNIMRRLIAVEHRSVPAQVVPWLDLAGTGQSALERDGRRSGH